MISCLELFTVRNKTTVIRAEGWRSTDTPTSIWELVPILGSLQIALRLVGPEDRSDIFLLTLARITQGERKLLLDVENSEALDRFNDGGL